MSRGGGGDGGDNGMVIDMLWWSWQLMAVVLVMRSDGKDIYLLVIEDNDAYADVDSDWLWWLMMLMTSGEHVDNDGDSYW